MTRIAYICADPGVPVFGCKGSSVHVQEVIRAMLRSGAGVSLFASRFGGEIPEGLEGTECVALPQVEIREGAAREQAQIAAAEQLPDLLDRHGPFGMVYERYSLWSHAAMGWARGRGIPALLEVNAPLIEEQAEHRELHDHAAAQRIGACAFAGARNIIAVSSGVAAYLTRSGVALGKVHVVPNGVATHRFDPAPRPRGDALVVGFVGTLKPWHGLAILVEAARIARGREVPLRLLVVGDGPERGELEAQLRSSGLADVTELTGAVSPGEIPGLIARMDVAVAPYPDLPDFYFSPLKIMEYMAAGRATVASRIGDIDGLIVHGENGMLCHPGQASAIADALVQLHRDPALRDKLGENARAKALAELGWDSVVARILALAREPAPC